MVMRAHFPPFDTVINELDPNVVKPSYTVPNIGKIELTKADCDCGCDLLNLEVKYLKAKLDTIQHLYDILESRIENLESLTSRELRKFIFKE